jgi:hypothetical protein
MQLMGTGGHMGLSAEQAEAAKQHSREQTSSGHRICQGRWPAGSSEARITTRKEIAMASENKNNGEILIYNEAHYEELASEEEIYLEEIEEELRADLLSFVLGSSRINS